MLEMRRVILKEKHVQINMKHWQKTEEPWMVPAHVMYPSWCLETARMNPSQNASELNTLKSKQQSIKKKIVILRIEPTISWSTGHLTRVTWFDEHQNS